MTAVDKKRTKKQHTKKETTPCTLVSIVTLPPPLQVSSRLLFSSPTASSPHSDLLFCLFFHLIRKLRDRGGLEKGETKKRKGREETGDINKVFVFLLWLVLHNNTTHFLAETKT